MWPERLRTAAYRNLLTCPEPRCTLMCKIAAFNWATLQEQRRGCPRPREVQMAINQAEVSGTLHEAPTRGQRLWREMLERRRSARLSLHRARLRTASFQESEGQPVAIRRAKAFANVLKGIPLRPPRWFSDPGPVLRAEDGAATGCFRPPTIGPLAPQANVVASPRMLR